MKKLSFLISIFLFAFGSAIAQNREAITALQKADQQFFIENKGQWPSEVLYLTQSAGVNTWITRKGMWFEFFKTEEIKITDKPMTNEFAMPEKFEHKETKRWGHRVGYTLVDNNQSVRTESSGKQEDYYNYLLGNDPSKHASFVGLYKEVIVNEVYEGISMRYYFDQGNFRYDYILESGADPSKIQFRFDGCEDSYLNGNGELVFTTCFGEVINADLFCYQKQNKLSSKKPVAAQFKRLGSNWVIELGDYSHEQILIIDPLIYSTYIGGNLEDRGTSIVLDTLMNAYIAGYTSSPNYNITPGAFQNNYTGQTDVLVSKLNASGSSLIFSTFIGGSNNDFGQSIAIGQLGEIYITGDTRSINYPITPGAFQSINGGNADIFVTKLSATGSSLIYSTFLGDFGTDGGTYIVLDMLGNAYVTGFTGGKLDITPGAFQINCAGGFDAFVTKLNSSGTALIYSTYIGGNNSDFALSLAIDFSENIYITGETKSSNYPITQGAIQTSLGGKTDAFVTKLNSTGTAVIYSTFLGGLDNDFSRAIAVDSVGSAFVTGRTHSIDFDVTADAFQTVFLGVADGFVAKLNATGTNLLYSTYIGGSAEDDCFDIEIDGLGQAIVAGGTSSIDYYTSPGAFQISNAGTGDVFVSKLNASGTSMIYSTFIGGLNYDLCLSASLDNSNYLYITGLTEGANFPTSGGAYQNFFAGGYHDIFVSKILVCTGIAESMQDNTILIYPNPNNGTFTLQTSKFGNYELLDIAGRIIRTYEVKSSPYIITEKLSSGMYFIREKDSGASIRNRVAQKVLID